MSRNPKIAERSAVAGLKLAQDSMLYSMKRIMRVGKMVMVYHLLWERNSKKSD